MSNFFINKNSMFVKKYLGSTANLALERFVLGMFEADLSFLW